MSQSDSQPDDLSLFGMRPSDPDPPDGPPDGTVEIAEGLLSHITSPPNSSLHEPPPERLSSDPLAARQSGIDDLAPAPSEQGRPASASHSGVEIEDQVPPPPADAILAPGNVPFSDPDAAFHKARRMQSETGDSFAVQPVAGGFVVIPRHSVDLGGDTDERPAEAISRTTASNMFDKNIEDLTIADFPEDHLVHKRGVKSFKALAKRNKKHRQSYRSQLLLAMVGLLGVATYFYPVKALSLLFDEAEFADIAAIIPEGVFIQVFAYIAGLVALIAFGRILWTRLYYRYVLSNKYAHRTEGLLKKDQTRIYYQNIRTVEVQQGLIGMLLNYGTVELSTAGSDGSEIVFENVANPELMQSVIEYMTMKIKRAGDPYTVD